jgi:hypothetical protein
VLINTYNDEPFLSAAIDSVLAQTFADFELVVVIDASTDRSRDIVAGYRDPRLRVLVNETNVGPGASLNRGLATIGAEYVAHLDGNDLCLPERLARQVAYLDARPEVAAVGSQVALVDVAGRRIGELRRPVTVLGMRWHHMFGSPVVHSAATYRRAVVWDALGGYDDRFRYLEDFDLWRRMARSHAIANLPETLVAYRVDPRSITGAERHPAREGYRPRKAMAVRENLRETLRLDDVPRREAELWVDTSDPDVPQAGQDVREVVTIVQRWADCFAALEPDAVTNAEVVDHQAGMLVRVLAKAPAAGRRFALSVWTRIWRRHRPTALRALPRLLAILCLGDHARRLHRALRRRRLGTEGRAA